MKSRLLLLLCALPGLALHAAETTAAAATPADTQAPVDQGQDLIEYLVDLLLHKLGLPNNGNTLTHWALFAGFIIASWVLRNFVTTAVFNVLKHFASKTETTLDDKLFPALEGPTKGLVFVVGTLMAFKVLKLSAGMDASVGYAYKVAFPAVIFWGLIKAIDAIIEHLGEMARERGMGIAAFLPLVKKVVVILFVIIATLTIIQSFGYDVKTFLAGLGIGGLAFALAAQDTIANLFGSFVVAMDQPFHVGDTVQIGSHTGKVEGIGMRSTKLRTPARTLIAIPNRTVANDAIVNFTRMPQRRVDQTIGLTYDTTPEQMASILGELRQLLNKDPEVHKDSATVYFTNYGDSSLDIQVVYFTANPDWAKHLETRERINLAIMKLIADRKLSFAFPTRTIQLEGPVAKSLAKLS
jgi:MscS family membrane protein